MFATYAESLYRLQRQIPPASHKNSVPSGTFFVYRYEDPFGSCDMRIVERTFRFYLPYNLGPRFFFFFCIRLLNSSSAGS